MQELFKGIQVKNTISNGLATVNVELEVDLLDGSFLYSLHNEKRKRFNKITIIIIISMNICTYVCICICINCAKVIKKAAH